MIKKERKCPLLKRYNYPYKIDSENMSQWFREICDKHCSLSDVCFEDSYTKILSLIREKLKTVTIPCPKCGAKDNWTLADEDGLKCLHCSNLIYHRTVLPMKDRKATDKED